MKYEGPFIIGISVGIGSNITEAQLALKEAKLRKEEVIADKPIKIRFNGHYPIAAYAGESMHDKIVTLDDLKSDLKILKKYKDISGIYNDFLKVIEGKKVDKNTGTLTPYGYQLELLKIMEYEKNEHKRRGYENDHQRQILFFDCNDMHHWNNLTIYDEVTEHIVEIGKALGSKTHNIEPGDRKSDLVTRVMEDNPLVHRLHGSAGDEFIVNVRCPEDKLVPLAERLIQGAYIAQMDMYNPKEKKQIQSMFI